MYGIAYVLEACSFFLILLPLKATLSRSYLFKWQLVTSLRS